MVTDVPRQLGRGELRAGFGLEGKKERRVERERKKK